MDKTANWALRVRRITDLGQRIENAKALLSTGALVSEVAVQSGFSSGMVFSKSFKAQTGFSPTEWQTKIGVREETRARVERAEALLLTGQHTLAAIAEMLGYRSPDGLRQAFYHVHGVAASSWLKAKTRGGR